MKVPTGPTIKQLRDQISHLRPEDRATAMERTKARRDLMKHCPYLFAAKDYLPISELLGTYASFSDGLSYSHTAV